MIARCARECVRAREQSDDNATTANAQEEEEAQVVSTTHNDRQTYAQTLHNTCVVHDMHTHMGTLARASIRLSLGSGWMRWATDEMSCALTM